MTSRWPLSSFFLALALLVHSANAAAKGTALSVLNSTDDVKFGPGLLAVLAILVGAVVCVAGYRLFRITIFVCGFILGGIGVASLIEFLFKNKSWMNTASWIGFFVGGVIVGMIAIGLYKASIFIAGAAGGVLLAFAIHTTVAYKISPSHPNTVLVILAVALAILGGILATSLERPVLIIATSFIGAITTTWGVGYFAGEFPNGADLKRYSSKGIDGKTIISIPHAWWGYLAGILVLFVLGASIQFKKTGRNGNYHRKHDAAAHAAVPPSYNDAQTPPTHPQHGNPVSHV